MTTSTTSTTSCKSCPLRKLRVFTNFTREEEDFMVRFKAGELQIEAGAPVVSQGAKTPHLYTVLSGVGLRYSTLDDGRRQILNFVFPGDLIGLQSAVMTEMSHSVEAKSDMKLCVFPRSRFWELFKQSPERSYDVVWLAARAERLLSDNLVSVGRMSGLERISYLFHSLFQRYTEVGMTTGRRAPLHFTQSELADAVGLSLVHTNKMIQKLRGEGLIEISESGFEIRNPEALAALAKVDVTESRVRPLI